MPSVTCVTLEIGCLSLNTKDIIKLFQLLPPSTNMKQITILPQSLSMTAISCSKLFSEKETPPFHWTTLNLSPVSCTPFPLSNSTFHDPYLYHIVTEGESCVRGCVLCYAYCVLCLLLIHANSLKIYLLWQVAKKSLCKHGGGGGSLPRCPRNYLFEPRDDKISNFVLIQDLWLWLSGLLNFRQ